MSISVRRSFVAALAFFSAHAQPVLASAQKNYEARDPQIIVPLPTPNLLSENGKSYCEFDMSRMIGASIKIFIIPASPPGPNDKEDNYFRTTLSDGTKLRIQHTAENELRPFVIMPGDKNERHGTGPAKMGDLLNYALRPDAQRICNATNGNVNFERPGPGTN